MTMCRRLTEKETLESSIYPWNRINHASLTESALWYKMFYPKGCQANSPHDPPNPTHFSSAVCQDRQQRGWTKTMKVTSCVPQSRHEEPHNTAKVWKLSGDQLKLMLSDIKIFLSNSSTHSEKLIKNLNLTQHFSPKNHPTFNKGQRGIILSCSSQKNSRLEKNVSPTSRVSPSVLSEWWVSPLPAPQGLSHPDHTCKRLLFVICW